MITQGTQLESLPTRERGLKPPTTDIYYNRHTVAPYAGAWIETPLHKNKGDRLYVAPYAGAWIETSKRIYVLPHFESLPTRERGLKRLILK